MLAPRIDSMWLGDAWGSATRGVFLAPSLPKTSLDLTMPTLISKPTRVEAVANLPIVIDEYFGRVNSNDSQVSVALLRCPAGWIEPGQTPEFEEFTIVLKG